MLGCGYLPLYTPEHVTDLHEMVVHHVGQVVRGVAVRFQDNRIP